MFQVEAVSNLLLIREKTLHFENILMLVNFEDGSYLKCFVIPSMDSSFFSKKELLVVSIVSD